MPGIFDAFLARCISACVGPAIEDHSHDCDVCGGEWTHEGDECVEVRAMDCPGHTEPHHSGADL